MAKRSDVVKESLHGGHSKLLNFFMQRYTLEERIIFLTLNTAGRVFAILRRDVARHSWYTAVFLLCALQNYLYSITFLCHFCTSFSR